MQRCDVTPALVRGTDANNNANANDNANANANDNANDNVTPTPTPTQVLTLVILIMPHHNATPLVSSLVADFSIVVGHRWLAHAHTCACMPDASGDRDAGGGAGGDRDADG